MDNISRCSIEKPQRVPINNYLEQPKFKSLSRFFFGGTIYS